MKKAIFSCLFGNYDQLNQAPKFEGWEAILFTDTKPVESKGWEIRLTETYSPKLDSRCYKFLSHIHLPEYDLVCYQDANIILKEEPPSNPVWLRHPRRKKVADEATRMIQFGKMTKQESTNIFRFFRQNRFNDNAGLYQNGFFVRSNRSEKMNKLMELTFDTVAKLNCRDQLALPYATWKLGYRPEGTVNYYLNDNQIEFLPHLNQVSNKIQVHHITSARSDKNFGKAVNEAIEGLPDQDWICLRDIDTIPPDHVEFIKQCEEIANSNHGFALIGCMTNRLGLKYQLVPGMFDEWDMRKHREKAKELSAKKSIKALGKGQTVGGVLMLFPKSVWLRAGKFPEGGISINNNFVDYHFSKAVGKFGKLGIAEGVYVFHHYRPDAKDTRTAKEHLK